MVLLILYVRAARVGGLESAGQQAVVCGYLLMVAVKIQVQAHRVLLEVLLHSAR